MQGKSKDYLPHAQATGHALTAPATVCNNIKARPRVTVDFPGTLADDWKLNPAQGADHDLLGNDPVISDEAASQVPEPKGSNTGAMAALACSRQETRLLSTPHGRLTRNQTNTETDRI